MDFESVTLLDLIMIIENEIKNFYSEFRYPKEFLFIKNLNLLDLKVWYIMTDNQIIERLTGLMKRYPNRKLIPFARRDDCDDIACFELNNGGKIEIIHDFATDGWEQKEEFSDFWAWFKSAVDTMILSAADE